MDDEQEHAEGSVGYGKCNLQYIPDRSRECVTIYGKQPRPPADEVEAERRGNDPEMASADMERARRETKTI